VCILLLGIMHSYMHTQNMRSLDALCRGACVWTNVNLTYERATFNTQGISIYIGKMSVRLLSYELACPCWRCMPVRTCKPGRTLNPKHVYNIIYITDNSYRARACSSWIKVLRENPSAAPKCSAARFRMRIISFPQRGTIKKEAR